MTTKIKIKNRLTELFNTRKNNLLNIYFTAGFPKLNDTVTIIKALETSGADMIEIGMPFSDPLADGPIIQQSNEAALENGMTIKILFEQIKDIRKEVKIPILLMGYLNPVLQYGIEDFCKRCNEVGIDGLILPDLPLQEYNEMYRELFEANNLSNVFLVTPHTSASRLKLIDKSSQGFIYIVSTDSTTGNTKNINDAEHYFKRIKDENLANPTMIGFNIRDNASFRFACSYSNGAIIGSAFIKMIKDSKDLEKDTKSFVSGIKK
ncbi:MAG TPA: tryptophan synthase subunit alpha [Cytophagaceae bacterium]|jgi:tryptophan synthase alpha chain|nr:tryptophan synthase subunit alpha [Cytophagaceae bacterium]